jgi:pimeloyl-ACP methyl ester carboxylesterase
MSIRRTFSAAWAASLGLAVIALVPAGAAAGERDLTTVHYKTVAVDGLQIFYREAGDPKSPTVLLLHGFPTSSQMYRNLIPRLADKYHVVAPDYPGFGQSSMPDRAQFSYTFDHLSQVVEHFTDAMHLTRYALYVMDYGAPVGFRLAVQHPERVTALIVQNGNAYDEGLQAFWDPLRAYWADNSPSNRDALRPFLTLDGTKWQYTHGVSDPTLLSPDAWTTDQYLLDRAGNKEIQLDLFYDYRTNVAQYPAWHDYLRTYQPPTLIVWGRNDEIFPAAGAEAFKRDLVKIDFHLLDAGHFALESNGPEIASLMRQFLGRAIKD